MGERKLTAWALLLSCLAAGAILFFIITDDHEQFDAPVRKAPALPKPSASPSQTKPPMLASNSDYRKPLSALDRRNGVIFRIEGGSNRISTRVLRGGRAYQKLRVGELVDIGCEEAIGVQTGSTPSRWNPKRPVIRSVIPPSAIQGRVSLDRIAKACRLFTPGEDGPAGFRILARATFAFPKAQPTTARKLRRAAQALIDFDFLRSARHEYCAMWMPEAREDCKNLYKSQRDGARKMKVAGKKSRTRLSGPVTLRRGVGAVGTRCGKQQSFLKFVRQPDGRWLFAGYS